MSSISLLEMNTSLSGALVASGPTGPQYGSSRCTPQWYQGYSHNQRQADNSLRHTGGWGAKNSLFGKEGDTRAKSRACYDCASWIITCKGAIGDYSWGASWNSSQPHWMAKGACWRLWPGCSCSMQGHTSDARCSEAIRISERGLSNNCFPGEGLDVCIIA